MARRIAAGPHRRAGGAAAAGPALAEGWSSVLASWRSDQVLAPQSGARLEEIGGRFVARLHQSGRRTWDEVSGGDCAAFVAARTRSGTAPSPATQHLRRSTVRTIFRTLRGVGALTGDPTLDLQLPPRRRQTYRPLTDDEVMLCRATSRLGESGPASLRRAVAWALGEATAASSEISGVRLGDLDNPQDPATVQSHRSRRYAARRGELSPWGRLVLGRHARRLLARGADCATLLAYSGTGPGGQYLAQASVCTQVTKVMELAGLRDDPAVRARSLRGWAGQSLYRSGMPLEQVAVRLGCNSLDAAATEIGLQWKPTTPDQG